MASPARAAARAPAAEALSREELASGHAWAAEVRRYSRRATRELHRKNGAAKILRVVLAYLASRVCVVDRRAVGVIAREAGVKRRHARRIIPLLEKLGYIARADGAGVRLEGQRGSRTNGIVVPKTLPNIDLLPPAARRRALQWDLANPKIRAALEAHAAKFEAEPAAQAQLAAQVPEAVPETLPPAAADSAVPQVDPVTERGAYTPPMGFCFCDLDRNCKPPSPVAPAVVEETKEGAVAPIPPIALPPASTVPEVPSLAAPPAADERQNGPRPTPPSTGTGAASSRRESWPTLPVELRDPRLPDEVRVAHYVAEGVPRSRAIAHVARFRRAKYAQQQLLEKFGEPPGRKPRWRGAVRERDGVERDSQRAIVEEGKRGFSVWTKLRGELADKASAPAWFDVLAHIRCPRETLGPGGEIVLHLEAQAEVRKTFEVHRDRIEEIARTTLPVRIQLVWEAS